MMGVNEGSLQVRYRGDIGKLTYIITMRYILTSIALVVHHLLMYSTLQYSTIVIEQKNVMIL